MDDEPVSAPHNERKASIYDSSHSLLRRALNPELDPKPKTFRVRMTPEEYSNLMDRISTQYPDDNACVFCRCRCMPKSPVGRYMCISGSWGSAGGSVDFCRPEGVPHDGETNDETDELYCCDKCYYAKGEDYALDTAKIAFIGGAASVFYIDSIYRVND